MVVQLDVAQRFYATQHKVLVDLGFTFTPYGSGYLVDSGGVEFEIRTGDGVLEIIRNTGYICTIFQHEFSGHMIVEIQNGCNKIKPRKGIGLKDFNLKSRKGENKEPGVKRRGRKRKHGTE